MEDAKIYRVEDSSLYARLNVCLDIGCEVAILDLETDQGFEFSEKLSKLTLKLNTITRFEIKKNCNLSESVTLTVSKIGKNKGIRVRNLKKMCDLFKLNTEQTRHIISSTSNRDRKCHILSGLKNIQMFARAIRAE